MPLPAELLWKSSRLHFGTPLIPENQVLPSVHASREMEEAVVKFFQQRLESLLRQETEIFTGLEDQIHRMQGTLGVICRFLESRSKTEAHAGFCSWADELKGIVQEMDDQVDQFIIQMDQQNASDELELKDCFRSELQNIESRLAISAHKMTQLESTTIQGEEGQKEDKKEQSWQAEDSQRESDTSAAAEGKKEEKEASKKQSHVKEKDQMDHDSKTTEEEKKERKHTKELSHDQKEGQPTTASSSAAYRLKYSELPYYLQSCLMYCCIFPENYWIPKGKLIRLLVAEGLTQEKPRYLLEDIAEENLNELVNRGMLQLDEGRLGKGNGFAVSPPYRMLLRESILSTLADAGNTIPQRARHILTSDMTKMANSLNNLRPRSLFVLGNQDVTEENWLNFTGAKFLRVLDLEAARIQSLPEDVGHLIHLTYLGLKHNDITELPATIGKLRALETLDIRWCKIMSISPELLNLVRLRHLKMFKSMHVSGMKLPEGISRLTNLLTLTGVDASIEFSRELGNLTQLRRLGVMDVVEESASELYASIMKMQGLLCLSLEAKQGHKAQHLIVLESFSPPPLLRKLRLEGCLEQLPAWLGSMESLTNLRLGYSHLSESPMSVLQLLPNLKNLTLWHAYDAKQLGKEFCQAGGFLKLEVLIIASNVIEEWTEIDEGALPSLQYLHFHNCLRLRLLPEGLQSITTLQQLVLLPLLDDHAERLKPDGGEENYKIRNIPRITFMPMSLLSSMVNSSPPSDG